jgi:uncharacterized damage-inducible protein DinB
MNIRALLVETHPHIPSEPALSDLSPAQAVERLPRAPHSIAEIVAHMSFWQSWFLARCEGRHEPPIASASLGWPGVEATDWPPVRDRFLAGLQRAVTLGESDARRAAPLAPAIEFRPQAGYTVGDALTHIAMHNAHHLGQIITLRQLMAAWPPPGGGFTW